MDVSIIVPLYKGQKYLTNILNMVKKNNQGEKLSIEVIFVNDFPSEMIELPDFQNKNINKVKLIVNKKNVGIHQSRIYGLGEASGEWILFLDQDDTIADTYLESQMEKSNGYDAVVSNGYWRNGETIYTETYPFIVPCSFDTFLKYGYPLVSLGQLMIRKKKLPEAWTRKALEHNGCDDLYLWALMMVEDLKVTINDDLVYTHEEDGKNASLNYKEMQFSIENVKRDFLGLNFVNGEKSVKFAKMMDHISSKYEQYDVLNTIFCNTSSWQIEKYLLNRNIKKLAIYGVGIYGKALLGLLKDTSIEVCYGIDIRPDVKNVGIPVMSIESEMQSVDAVIVTPIAEFESIFRILKVKMPFVEQVLCLNEILQSF